MSDQQPPQFPPPQGPGFPYMPPPSTPSAGGFFGALFDFSFSRFVTPMIVKVAYAIAVIGIAIAYVIFVVTAFSNSTGAGLLVLVLGAIGAFFYLLLIRMSLEFYLAIVRMSEDIHYRR